MNPLKAKELTSSIQSDLPQELREDLTDCYWDYIHKCINSLDYYHILIPHLGTFSVKGSFVLNEEIERLTKETEYSRKFPPRTTKMYAIFKMKQDKIDKLNKLLDNYNSEEKSRKQYKVIRANVRLEKDLAAQKADS